jgi:hypothetical protein
MTAMGFASLYPSYICDKKSLVGQITKNLSSPFYKNIPLNFQSKSSA